MHRELSPGGKVVTHDAVTRLRHPGGVLDAQDGRHPEAHERDPEGLAGSLHHVEVGMQLVAGFVDRPERRARELELPARTVHLAQPDLLVLGTHAPLGGGLLSTAHPVDELDDGAHGLGEIGRGGAIETQPTSSAK